MIKCPLGCPSNEQNSTICFIEKTQEPCRLLLKWAKSASECLSSKQNCVIEGAFTVVNNTKVPIRIPLKLTNSNKAHVSRKQDVVTYSGLATCPGGIPIHA